MSSEAGNAQVMRKILDAINRTKDAAAMTDFLAEDVSCSNPATGRTDTEPETVALPDPAQGQYFVQVFGKPAASTGAAFTLTGESVGAGGSVVSGWSFSGTATSATDIKVPVSVLSNGDVSSVPFATLPVPLVPLVLAIVILGAQAALFVPGRGSLKSRMRRRASAGPTVVQGHPLEPIRSRRS